MHNSEHPTIIIVNDQPLMSQALVSLLGIVLDRPVVLQADSLAEGIVLCRHQPISLAILGLDLPDAYGLDALKRFRCAAPSVTVLAVSAEDASAIVERILALGIKGYLSVRDTPAIFSAAIRRLLRGEHYVSPRFSSIQSGLMHNAAAPLRPPRHEQLRPQLLEGLTPRQREIVTLVGQGYTNKEIARLLGIAHGTVKNYVADMLSHFHVERRGALASRVLDTSLPAAALEQPG